MKKKTIVLTKDISYDVVQKGTEIEVIDRNTGALITSFLGSPEIVAVLKEALNEFEADVETDVKTKNSANAKTAKKNVKKTVKATE